MIDEKTKKETFQKAQKGIRKKEKVVIGYSNRWW
jgi:hypothetical protein